MQGVPRADISHEMGIDAAEQIGFGGEFRADALEAAFTWERLDETFRHARVLLLSSAILNTLFFLSDWRFYGTPHFWIAIPARTLVVVLALVCLALLRQCRSPLATTRLMAGWMAINALAVALLVSSHSNIALFVVIMLPLIYYLVVPASFPWTMAGGIGCSMAMLAGFGEYRASPQTGVGLALAMVVLNCALAMVVSRSNRLERLEWLAARNARAMAAELAASRETLEKMFTASPVPMIVTSRADGRILNVNDTAAALVGMPRENINGTLERFYVRPEDRARLLATLARDGMVSDFETDLRLADGLLHTVLLKATAVDVPDGPIVMAGIIDISDRKAIQLSLEWLASTDTLTGLPNRMSFFSTARAAMMRAARSGEPLSLLMVDIDHFKAINDTYGHQVGDQALKVFAGLCVARLNDQDIVGRLGGEEFGVLLPGTDLDGATATAEALRRALGTLAIPGAVDGFRMSASFGVSAVLACDADLDPALSRADMALYTAKRQGRNRVICDRTADRPARAPFNG